MRWTPRNVASLLAGPGRAGPGRTLRTPGHGAPRLELMAPNWGCRPHERTC